MKLGIGSYTYTWAIGVPGHVPAYPISALDLLEKARDLEVAVVQFCDNLPLTALSPSNLDLLVGRASDYGIAFELGTRGLEPVNMLAHLDLAKRLKASFVRFVIDHGSDAPSAADVITRVTPLMPAFAGSGVTFAIENHDRFPAQDLVRIVEALGASNCGICLDTVNSFGSLEMPKEVVGAFAPYTVNLHVKDFTIKRVPSAMGFTVMGCPAGAGRLDIPWVLDQLRRARRDVNAIVELWTPFGENIAATIGLEQQWAEESVQYMRTLISE